MKRQRGRSQEQATLDITPTIDVVFLLLIFFVSTIQLPPPEAELQTYLPKQEKTEATGKTTSDDQEETQNINRFVIGLRRAEGRFELKLNGAPLQRGFRQLDNQLGLLKQTSRQTPDIETKIILDAGETVPYRFVITTLDLCAKHRIRAMPVLFEAAI